MASTLPRLAVTLVLPVALLAGCAPASPSGASPQPTPAADAVTTALMRSKGLGTAALAVDATIERDGSRATLRGDGVTVLDRGDGRLQLTSADGVRTVILVNGKGVFTRAADEALWSRSEDRATVPEAGLVDPLTGLGGLGSVRRADDGHVTGTLPATVDALRQLGLSAAEAESALSLGTPADITVDVWLDDDARVGRVDRAVELPGLRATVSTRLSDYRVRADLTSPPSASVRVTGQP